MATEIVQVRDVPSADMEILRARAASRSMSISRYLRELIHDDTSTLSMDEVLARIATRSEIAAGSDAVLEAIDRDRR